MKSATKTVIFVLLMALGVVMIWLGFTSPKKPPEPLVETQKAAPTVPQEITPPTSGTQAANEPVLPNGVDHGVIQPFARTPYMGLSDPRWVDRRRLRHEDPEYQWRTPIEFFGKVIDENEHPVANAEVEFSWSGTVEKNGGDGVGQRMIFSDSNGEFVIKGIEGKGMTVRVKKEGYYRRGYPNGWFEYAAFWEPRFIEPEHNSPVIFRLVTRPMAEPTYRIGGRIILNPPSLETNLDLLSPTAQSNAPADLYVRIMRPPGASYDTIAQN